MTKNYGDHRNEKSYRETSRHRRNDIAPKSRGGAHTSSSIRDCHICGGRPPIVNHSRPFGLTTAANFVHQSPINAARSATLVTKFIKQELFSFTSSALSTSIYYRSALRPSKFIAGGCHRAWPPSGFDQRSQGIFDSEAVFCKLGS